MSDLQLRLLVPPGADDAEVRARIRTDLDTTLFVEAGAGSGKTTSLVDRVLALVESGVPMPPSSRT